MNSIKKSVAWILTLVMAAGMILSTPGAMAQAVSGSAGSNSDVAGSSGASLDSYRAASPDYNGERKLEFNEDWKFILSDVENGESMSYNDSSWKSVRLPHDWSIYEPYTQSVAPNAGSLPGGTGWYRKSFTAPAALADKKVSIQFDGVYMISDVYINEHHLGTQYLGYTTFRYDITEYLEPGEKNVIAVKVVSKTPNSRFYAGAGIYRNVWLNVTENLHVADDGVYITTPEAGITEASAAVKVQTDIFNDTAAPATVTLRSTVYHKKDGDVANVSTADITIPANKKQTIDQTVNVPNPKLWSTTSPNLYYMRTEVVSGGEVVDTLDTRFGIRYIKMVAGDNDQNGTLRHGFYLNGERVQLQGVCMHSDLGSLGMEVNQAAIDRQIRILKSFGVNAIRGSHNPVSPEFVEACDRMGILFQEEAFDCWEQGKNTNDYSNYFAENHKRDIEAMVQRDKNAPSVVMWSIGNEISESSNWWGLDMGKTLMGYIKAIDDSRIVTAGVPTWADYGDATQEHLAMLDMAGFNYKEAKYDEFHWKYPNKVIYGAETVSSQYSRGIYFQGDTTRQNNQCSSYGGSWNFNSPQYSLEMVRDRPYVAGEFVWTGFDFIGEPNPFGWPSKSSYWGIVDTCGFPKDVYYLYKSMWQPEVDTVHLVPQNWNHQLGDKIRIQLHTNAASVELFLNGKSLGVKEHDIYKPGTPVTIEWGTIDFAPGELKAVGKDKDGNVIATDAVYTAGEPAAITLSSDRTMIKADGKDLVFVEATIVDSKGNVCPTADDRIQFEATGGTIISVDNGNAVDHDPYRSDNRRAFSGKALVLVAADSVGDITITARASTDSGPIGSNTVTVGAVREFTEDPDKIVSMVESTIVVEKGSTATAIDILPKTVEIVYGNGVIERSTVTWTIPGDIDFSTLGSYRIEGTVTGIADKAVCTILVKELASAEDVSVMTYTKSAPMMPTFVPAKYTDGTTGAADVIWEEILPEKYAQKGTFDVVGKLAANPAIAVTAHVTVKDIVSCDPVSAMTTVGKLPTMPSTIEITLDDNTKETVTVWWSVSDADVMYSGTTQVTGIIAGTNFEVDATLTVMLERYVSDLEWVSATQDGIPGKRVSVDKAINGDALMSRNPQGGPPRAHAKGLGTAANSEIVYDISGQGYDRFQAYCSLHFITQEDNGKVNFKVFLDDAATPAYESGTMTYASTRAFIDVDIAGASKIRLVTEHVGDGPLADDLANWCDVKFLSEHIALSEIVDDNYFTITEIGRTPGLPATVTAHTKDGAVAEFRVEWDPDDADFTTAGGKVVQGNIVGTDGAKMTANIIVDFDAVVADPSLAANITSYQRTDRFEYTDIADKHSMTKELLGQDTLITDFSSNMLVEVVNNYSLGTVVYPEKTSGYVIYRGLDIKSFELRSAAREDASERFNIYTSSNGTDFAPFTDYIVIDSPPGDWNPKLHSSGPLPANTNYIKVEFPKNLDWKFNLNRITLSGGATAMITGVTVPKSNLIVGFTGDIETHVNTVNITNEVVTVKLLDAKGKVLSTAEANVGGRADLPVTLSVTHPLPVGEYSVVASLSGVQGVKSTTITVTDILPRDGWTATAHAYTEEYEGGKPEKAIDGDIKSRWADGRQQDGSEGRWFQVDMGRNQNIGAISIDARNAADDYGRKYNVYTRPDGSGESDWVCVKSNVTIKDPYQMITFPGRAARYIRVDQIGATDTGCWWSICDFNAYGTVSVAADTYAVDIPPAANGTVTADIDNAEIGETVTLTITPAVGYELHAISAHKTGEEITDVTLSGTGNTRTFSMPGHDVTVTAAFRKTADQSAVEAAKVLIEGGSYTVDQAVANEEEAVAAWLESELAGLPGVDGIEMKATISSFTAAVADAAEEDGSDGAYIFTVTLTKNDSAVTTDSLNGTITKTLYTPSGQTAAPVFTNSTQTFTDETAKTVAFILVGGTAEIYTVYDAKTEGNVLSDPAVTADGAKLTLSFTDLPEVAATYYISATEDSKTESTRTAVTVKPYEAPKSGEKLILRFAIADQLGETSIDQNEYTVAVTMPEGTDLTALTPIITVSAAATVTPASGVEQDFSSSVTYTVTAEDGTTQAYAVTVTEEEPAPATYTVMFHTNGGSAVASVTVNDGEKVAKPANPTRSGYDFVGWYSDETLAVAYDFDSTVTADLILYAKWEKRAEPDYTPTPPSNTTTETEKNPDGSTTTTVTNKNTGTVTKTTKHPDGTTQVVETKKDGTVTEKVTASDGTKTKRVKKPDGSYTATEERRDGTKVESTATADGKTAASVIVPKDKERVTVTIPAAEKPKSGEVAVIIHENGTREIVKTSVSTEDGLRVTLTGTAKLEIINNSKSFADMEEGHWAHDAVQFAASRELFTGTGKDSFSPMADMSRAMVVTVLARLDGQDTAKGETWSAVGVAWAKENGISSGSGLEDAISREQLAAMLYRYARAEKTETDLTSFSDGASISAWAAEAMSWAVESGIITGKGGALDPQGSATRAEVATMLQRFVENTI